MKFLPLLLFLSTFSLSSVSDDKLLCSTEVGLRWRKEIDSRQISDKAKHCSLSCIVARRCGNNNILVLGFLKEIVDIFGPGNAEIADLRANLKGTYFAFRSNQACSYLCEKSIPRL